WGLGSKERHDGALLIVALAERTVRIEVGRGLEGRLPDALCARIIREEIVPRMRAGQTYEALRAGLLAMHAAAGGTYATDRPRPSAGPSCAAPAVVLLVLFLMLVLQARGQRRRRGRWPTWGTPIVPGAFYGGRGGFSGGHGGAFSGGGFGSGGIGGFGGFGGGGGFSGGGASGRW